MTAAAIYDPGTPHYFGPYGNWAFSPLPKGGVATIAVTSPGTGYVSPVVTISDVYGTGSGATATATGGNGVIYGFTILTPGSGYGAPLVTITGDGTGATADAITSAPGAVTGFNITSGGSGYTTATVTILDDPTLCGGAAPQPVCGSGATASALIGDGGIVGITLTNPGTGYSAPWVTIADSVGPGDGATGDAIIGGPLTGGIRKFVDTLPNLGLPGGFPLTAGGADPRNGLGQYIPVGLPASCTYTSQVAECYSIALVEYSEQMHTDLPATKLRGYVQIYPPGTTPQPVGSVDLGVTHNGQPVYGYDKPHYLGPVIVAKGKVAGLGAAGAATPVRITFYNLLPNTASGGNLLIPVDETVPGSGLGPALPGAADDKYAQNRATIHLHGNNTVWISDGNTHQWITPASEATPYPAGVSARNVPDMGTACDAFPGDPALAGLPGAIDPVTGLGKSSGCMTFFYTNAQSARLQFYHDHAHGITRLNVYAGEAAGYVVTDARRAGHDRRHQRNWREPWRAQGSPWHRYSPGHPGQDLGGRRDGLRPGSDVGLGIGTIRDRRHGRFLVPARLHDGHESVGCDRNERLRPLVLRPLVQPPHPDVRQRGPGGMHRGRPRAEPVPSACLRPGSLGSRIRGCTAPWEPPLNPGVPNPSIPGESFLDTPIVNGTAYPVLTVEPKAYRFRILNAGNDRALNLQLYVAADKTAPTTAASNYALTPAKLCDPAVLPAVGLPSPGPVTNCTEVKMVPVSLALGTGKPVRRHAERRSRSGNGRTVVDPDRHRGWLHAGAGRDPAAADRVQPRPCLLQFRHRQPALAVPHASGARGCHR